MAVLYTLGHSTRPLEKFQALLGEHGIRFLVDVRRFPGSRRYPHFSKEALARSLAEQGIEYLHEPDLGGRRQPRPDSPHTAWRTGGFRGYADHMETPAFQSALRRLIERREPTTILCAEAVPWRCHRQLIADALVARGIEVRHILGPGSVEPHALHPAAVVLPDEKLLYPAPPTIRPMLSNRG